MNNGSVIISAARQAARKAIADRNRELEEAQGAELRERIANLRAAVARWNWPLDQPDAPWVWITDLVGVELQTPWERPEVFVKCAQGHEAARRPLPEDRDEALVALGLALDEADRCPECERIAHPPKTYHAPVGERLVALIREAIYAGDI